MMKVNLNKSWNAVLNQEFDKPYFCNLTKFVHSEYENYSCHPDRENIFSAFNRCTFDDVKVVIIGQDPYHGYGQANGLCFSVMDNIKHPPSLVNIFRELGTDVGKKYPVSGNLEGWANQGVLLLNTILTVRDGVAGSHQKKGWEEFTDAVIKVISNKKSDVIFLLWGGFAKKKGRKIDKNKHFVLETGHPSPLSANRGYWFGNKHFSKANEHLKKMNKKQIIW